MSYVKNDKTYCNTGFHKESTVSEFYLHLSLKELAARSELNKDVTFRCRTIGILQSVNGRFYLTELTTPVYRSETSIQLSAAYLKSPPPSTVIPYPVQVFGTVQWCKKPVLVAKFIQTLNATMALRMKDAVTSITDTHLAAHSDQHFEREAKI